MTRVGKCWTRVRGQTGIYCCPYNRKLLDGAEWNPAERNCGQEGSARGGGGAAGEAEARDARRRATEAKNRTEATGGGDASAFNESSPWPAPRLQRGRLTGCLALSLSRSCVLSVPLSPALTVERDSLLLTRARGWDPGTLRRSSRGTMVGEAATVSECPYQQRAQMEPRRLRRTAGALPGAIFCIETLRHILSSSSFDFFPRYSAFLRSQPPRASKTVIIGARVRSSPTRSWA